LGQDQTPLLLAVEAVLDSNWPQRWTTGAAVFRALPPRLRRFGAAESDPENILAFSRRFAQISQLSKNDVLT
jgi:hypothetical protein